MEISSDEIAFVLPALGVNSERLAATTDTMATISNAMATVLTVLGLQFVARGLASNSFCGRAIVVHVRISGVCSVRSPCA